MYMIMGFNYNNYNKDDSIDNIIISNINYLNTISSKKYKTEDFIIVAIINSNNNMNNMIVKDILNGFININYNLFNLKDIVFNLKNKENVDYSIKYTLTLPIINIYNMMMDICNNTIFESKLYSIDNNNNENWKNIPLNEIENW